MARLSATAFQSDPLAWWAGPGPSAAARHEPRHAPGCWPAPSGRKRYPSLRCNSVDGVAAGSKISWRTRPACPASLCRICASSFSAEGQIDGGCVLGWVLAHTFSPAVRAGRVNGKSAQLLNRESGRNAATRACGLFRSHRNAKNANLFRPQVFHAWEQSLAARVSHSPPGRRQVRKSKRVHK
jgi:hypothetical protein